MRVDNDLKPKVIQCDIHGANGLAFSADQRWMYTSEYAERRDLPYAAG